MTSKEALKDIYDRNEALKKEKHFHIGEKVMNIMKELVERDTPMKPIIDLEEDSGYCPMCNKIIWKHYIRRDKNFCNRCGQKLDWRVSIWLK